MARGNLSKRVRFTVFKRDDFKCQYCGKTGQDVELHVDHIRPVCLGGTNDLDNLVTACASCNLGKAGIPLTGEQENRRRFLAELRMERLVDLLQIYPVIPRDYEEFQYTEIELRDDDPPAGIDADDVEDQCYWIRHAQRRRSEETIHLWHKNFTAEDLPEGYYFKAGPWIVTDLGLECLQRFYPIPAEDLGKPWRAIIDNKDWPDIPDFTVALERARELHAINEVGERG